MPYFIYRVFPLRRLEKVTEKPTFGEASVEAKALRASPGPSRRLHDQGDLRRERERGRGLLSQAREKAARSRRRRVIASGRPAGRRTRWRSLTRTSRRPARTQGVTRRALRSLVAAVQANCHISDARHARNMTMCTYLLEMREQYRWERGMALDCRAAARGGGRVARPSARRSGTRSSMASTGRCRCDDALVDPFDVATVNRELVPRGWVYGAGIGRFGKPQFFLAELEREEWRDGVRVLIAGREHARDLAPAPAALRADTIYVRTDVLRRLLWERAAAVDAPARRRSVRGPCSMRCGFAERSRCPRWSGWSRPKPRR